MNRQERIARRQLRSQRITKLTPPQAKTFNFEAGTRVRWAHRGNLEWGTIVKISPKSVEVNETKSHPANVVVQVSKELIFEVIKW